MKSIIVISIHHRYLIAYLIMDPAANPSFIRRMFCCVSTAADRQGGTPLSYSGLSQNYFYLLWH